MIEKLKSPIVQNFIQEHQHDDPVMLMLKMEKFPDLPIREIVQQIQSRQKARQKLPEWHRQPGVLFPPALSMEQCSSQATAKFKTGLVAGKSMIDLTGGAGIDSYYFSSIFTDITYVERNAELCEVARHNYHQLSARINVVNDDAPAFLSSLAGPVDLIYLDPARRDDQAKKVFLLEDCEPDVVGLQDELLRKANQVLIKTSPMLDIQLAENALRNVKAIYVVAVSNEVKEVLYLMERDWEQEAAIYTANLSKSGGIEEAFSFTRSEEQGAQSAFGSPQRYVYEPNGAILKAGAFKMVGNEYGVLKLHPHSHLYTSDELVPRFPGRTFECVGVVSYNRKAILQHLPEKKANITTRNFPDSVAAIRRKTGIKEGGERFLFATTDVEDKLVVLVCNKIQSGS